jgi:hypothetical protein
MRFKLVKFATITISIARYAPSKLVSISIQTANQWNPPASSCSEYTADLADPVVVKKLLLELLNLRRLGLDASGLFRNGASSWLRTLFAFSRKTRFAEVSDTARAAASKTRAKLVIFSLKRRFMKTFGPFNGSRGFIAVTNSDL